MESEKVKKGNKDEETDVKNYYHDLVRDMKKTEKICEDMIKEIDISLEKLKNDLNDWANSEITKHNENEKSDNNSNTFVDDLKNHYSFADWSLIKLISKDWDFKNLDIQLNTLKIERLLDKKKELKKKILIFDTSMLNESKSIKLNNLLMDYVKTNNQIANLTKRFLA